jgi:lipopolysaccharide/colanic/teichoic acid biosynthesis glycosyltransferase
MYTKICKRSLDLIISLLVIILLSPVFLIITGILLFQNKGNAFFLQKRPGKNRKIFSVIKFKTMNDKVDDSGKLLPDALRTTSVGKFLRKTSLDEIPQLLNVVKGDMSLIGPRPLLVEYLPKYTKVQDRRHLVRPGITGLSQISGRQEIYFSKRLELDIKYVDNLTFMMDCKILLKTIPEVLKSRGVKTGQDVKEVDDLGLSSQEE